MGWYQVKLSPIPMCALPDSLSVRRPSDDGRGFEDPVTIEHVRFIDVKVYAANSYAIDDDANGILYVDATNSDGAFPIPVGSLVRVNGSDEMSVIKITPAFGFDSVHHWKIEVR